MYRCLQENVLMWHDNLLSSIKQRLLIFDDDLTEWKIALIINFKKSTIKIMKNFVNRTYSMKNVESHRFIREYIQNIIRLNKIVELFFWNQLLQIWNDFEIDFQLFILKSIKNTRMSCIDIYLIVVKNTRNQFQSILWKIFTNISQTYQSSNSSLNTKTKSNINFANDIMSDWKSITFWMTS